VKVIDAVLKVETPYGPCWHRYGNDGYGEHDDGRPFDGTGVGRAWPLLTGERAHYELAAGRRDRAEQLMQVLEAFGNEGGMIPEQIWDAPDIPAGGLIVGHPTGSAMPLVWAHAEYVKLRRSLHEERVFDTPSQSVQRYVTEGVVSPLSIWRFNEKSQRLASGQIQRVETLAPAVVRWSIDDWETVHEAKTRDTGLGIHVADLPTDGLAAGTTLFFTFYWPEADREEGRAFTLQVVDSVAGSDGQDL
jgi:glucoamylase